MNLVNYLITNNPGKMSVFLLIQRQVTDLTC